MRPEYQTKKMQVKEPSLVSSLLGLITEPFGTSNRLMSTSDNALLFAYAICLMSLACAWLIGPFLLMQTMGVQIRLDRVFQVTVVLLGSFTLCYLLTAIIFFVLGLRISLLKLFCMLWFGFAPIIYVLIGASLYDYAIDGNFHLHLMLIGSGFPTLGILTSIMALLTLAFSITAFAGAISAQCDYPVMLAGIFGIFCIALFYLSLVLVANLANDLSGGYALGLQSLVARVHVTKMLGLRP